jgi:hypothetical protein
VPPLPDPVRVVVDVTVDVVVVAVVGETVDVVVVVSVADGTLVESGLVTVEVDVSPPVLDAMTARATPSPITAATSNASAHLTPPLMRPDGGRPRG